MPLNNNRESVVVFSVVVFVQPILMVHKQNFELYNISKTGLNNGKIYWKTETI